MTEPPGKHRSRHVVVALSGFGDLRPILRQAARLAASLDADLSALLVEDESLQRMAALPFVDQVSLATARRVPMQAADLEQQMTVFSRLAERMIAEVAREAGIAGRIQTAHGQVATALRAAVRPGDLVMICAGRPLGITAGPRHLAEAALAELSDCDLLLQDLRPGATGRIAVCDDGTDPGRRAVETAAALARAYGSELTVIDVDHHQRELPATAKVKRATDTGLDLVRSVLREETPSILVLPANLAEKIGTLALVQTSGCAVLIVR
jgi:K+-sensing histidine kinase KdpD